MQDQAGPNPASGAAVLAAAPVAPASDAAAFEARRLDTVKGLLIACIVYGHARIVHDFAGASVGFLYLWHVQSFFLLAALAPRPLAGARARDVAVRYLVPFAVFVTALAILSVLGGKPAGEGLRAWGAALLFASAPHIGAATGASVYWFLPSFLWVSLLLSALARLPRRAALAAALVVVVLGVLRGAGGVPLGTLQWPLGSGLVFYLTAQALVFAALWHRIAPSPTARVLALGVGLLLLVGDALWWAARPPLVNAALYRFGPDPLHALGFMLVPPLVLPAVMVLAANGWLQRLFAYLGRRSMLVYLLHQPLLYPLWLLWKRIVPPPYGFAAASLVGLVMTLVVIAVALAVGEAIWRIPRLKALVLPAGWHEWRGAFRLAPPAR